jgi:hypothetical protein
LESDIYLEKLPAIRAMKRRYLEEYHLPIHLVRLLERYDTNSVKKKNVRLYSESFYYDFRKGMYHLRIGAQILATRAISKISSLL